MEDALYRGNREPTLDQILAEPAVRILMRRDGIGEAAIRQLLRQAAAALKPPEARKLRFIAPAPPTASAESAQASAGVLAQAAAVPHWPRVFPSL